MSLEPVAEFSIEPLRESWVFEKNVCSRAEGTSGLTVRHLPCCVCRGEDRKKGQMCRPHCRGQLEE